MDNIDNNHSNNNLFNEQNIDIKKNNEGITNLNINNIIENKISINNNDKMDNILELKNEEFNKNSNSNSEKEGLISHEISNKEKANIEYENILKKKIQKNYLK